MKPYIKNTSKGTVFIFVRRVNSRNRKCLVSVPIKSSREYHFKSGDILDDQMISYYKNLEAAFGFIVVLPESESDAAEFKTPEGVVEPPTHSVIRNYFSKKNKKDKDKNKDKDKDKHDNYHLQDNEDFDPVDPDPAIDPDIDKDSDHKNDKDKDKDHDDNRNHDKHDNDDNPHNDQDHKDNDSDNKTEDPGQEDTDSESDEQSNATIEDADPVDPEVLVTEDSTELEQQIDKKYNKDTLIQMCADFGIEGVDDKMLKADIIKILVENAADQVLELVQQN